MWTDLVLGYWAVNLLYSLLRIVRHECAYLCAVTRQEIWMRRVIVDEKYMWGKDDVKMFMYLNFDWLQNVWSCCTLNTGVKLVGFDDRFYNEIEFRQIVSDVLCIITSYVVALPAKQFKRWKVCLAQVGDDWSVCGCRHRSGNPLHPTSNNGFSLST